MCYRCVLSVAVTEIVGFGRQRPLAFSYRKTIMADLGSSSLWESYGYPPPAFYFKVIIGLAAGMSDTSFQEVTGIGSEIETEAVVEGGENRYVHHLPKGVTHPKMVLRRGIAKITSPLVIWCRSVLEADFATPIIPMPMMIFLLNENEIPIRAWYFDNAYPVNWEVESFESTKNEVAIEKIELRYNYSNRIL
jgi:phage tail-like protein